MSNKDAGDKFRFWIHFVFGLIFGAAISAWLAFTIFSGGWPVMATISGTALVVAYSCGRWGDPAWHWILEKFSWMR